MDVEAAGFRRRQFRAESRFWSIRTSEQISSSRWEPRRRPWKPLPATMQVESTSTQLGDVIQDTKMEQMPLNGRSFIDLIGLQAGVVP